MLTFHFSLIEIELSLYIFHYIYKAYLDGDPVPQLLTSARCDDGLCDILTEVGAQGLQGPVIVPPVGDAVSAGHGGGETCQARAQGGQPRSGGLQ